MQRQLLVTLFVSCLAIAGCVKPSDTPTRSATSSPSVITSNSAASTSQSSARSGRVILAAKYTVNDVKINVPQSLVVSEANSYLPNADIVWRGDVRGDRYAQVKAIFAQAATTSTALMVKGPAVTLEIEVVKFHCLTEKTRYTVGGVHTMRFLMTVRDAATGMIIEAPRLINADINAAGGQQAIAEDAAGRTQKVVVTEQLAQVIRRELSAPVRPADANLMVARGLISATAIIQ
jgi:hypothetical protein